MIVISREDLVDIIKEAFGTFIGIFKTSPIEPPDSIDLDSTIELLKEHGFHISKAKIYKLTSADKIPYRKYGNRLLFSRKDIIAWAQGLVETKPDQSDTLLALARNTYKSTNNK